MKQTRSTVRPNSLAVPLAPEDVRNGDFVAVLNVTCEFPSFLWFGDAAPISPHELVRLQFLPAEGGIPLKVKAVCLPFLCLRSPDRRTVTLDVRQVQLVRLSRDYAQTVWRELRKEVQPDKREMV